MNGDLLTDLEFNALVAFHRAQGATLTIATHTRHIKIDLGVLEFDRDHRITGYHEKPEKTYDVSMGIYVYEPHVMKYIEPGKYLDFPDLVVRLIAQGERVCGNSRPIAYGWISVAPTTMPRPRKSSPSAGATPMSSDWSMALSDLDYGPEEEHAAVAQVLQSKWLSMGPEVEAFEKEFASFIGVERARHGQRHGGFAPGVSGGGRRTRNTGGAAGHQLCGRREHGRRARGRHGICGHSCS